MPVAYTTNLSTITSSAIDGTETVPVYASAVVAQAELAGVVGCRATDPSYTPAAISAITLASGVITTSAAHGLLVNDRVYIAGIVGTTQLNGRSYLVNSVNSTQISLKTYRATPGTYRTYDVVNTSGYSAWTSGGSVYKLLNQGTANVLQIVSAANPAAWLAVDQDWTLVLTGGTYFNPAAESSGNANNGGVTVLHYGSVVIVKTIVSKVDGAALACNTGGRFFALRTPHGVSPQVINLASVRHDWPTLLSSVAPAEYRIEGLSVYSTLDSRKWYGGNSRNAGSRDLLSNLALSGYGEIFQAHNTVYTTPTIPNLTFGGETSVSSIELISPTFGTELTGTTSLNPLTLRNGRLWMTDPSFSGWWNGAVDTPVQWSAGAYAGLRFTNRITVKSGPTAIQSATVRRKRSVTGSTVGYSLSSLAFGPEAADTFTSTDASGVSSAKLTDMFKGHTVGGLSGAQSHERYTWTCQVRKYDYATPSNTVYSARVYTAAVPEEVQVLAVSNLALTQAQAAALTGITMVASGTTGGTMTVTSTHSLSDLWSFYRNWISTSANFDSNDTWTYNGTTLNLGAWSIVASGVTITGNLTTTGTATTASGGLYAGVVIDSTGTTTVLTITGLSGHAVALYNNAGTRQSYTSSVTGTFTAQIASTATGVWTYAVTKHATTADIRTFTPIGGAMAFAQGTVTDPYVTQTTAATVAAYTSLDTPDAVYDYSSYWQTTATGIDVAKFTTKVGTVLSLGSVALVLDAGAGAVWGYSGGTLTVKSPASHGAGTVFSRYSTTGALTLTGVTPAYPLILTSNAGTTGWFSLTGLSSHALAVYDNTGTRNTYASGQSGQVNISLAAAVTGTWSYKIAKHANVAQTGTFTPAGGGLFAVAANTATDTAVTQPVAATVAAYTSLDSPDQLYDYSSYWQSTSTGIDVTKFTSKAGTTLDLGSVALVLDASAGTLWSYSGATLTAKSASSHTAGTAFTGYATTGALTLSGISPAYPLLLTSSAGTTGWLSLTGLAGQSVAVYNNSAAQVDYQGSITGNYRLLIAAEASGSWNWITKAGNELLATNSVTVAGGGLFSVAPLQLSDPAITQTTPATVAAYTTLDDLAQLYDYASGYYKSTATGIAQPTLATVLMTKSGTALDLGACNLIVDATAVPALAYNAGTSTITINASTLAAGGPFISLSTSGDITTANGALVDTEMIVTDSTGVTGHLEVTGLLAASSVAVFDETDTLRDYAASTSTDYHAHLDATATGTWSYVVKKPGYNVIIGTFPADGATVLAVNQIQILTPDGGAMYAGTSGPLATAEIGTTTSYLQIGDGLVGVQQAFDTAETAMATSAGMSWLLSGKAGLSMFRSAGGDFLFLSNGWRLRRQNTGDDNATLNSFATSTEGVVVDGSNGPIAFLSSSSNAETVGLLTTLPLIGLGDTPATSSVAWFLDRTLKFMKNKMVTDPVTGEMRVFDDDDTTVLFEGDLFEDVSGTVPFTTASTKINRRNRLT